MDNSARYRMEVKLGQHMALVRMRLAELKINPDANKWHQNPDGTVYRIPTELSVALAEATEELERGE